MKRIEPKNPPKSVRGWDDTNHCLYICMPEKIKTDTTEARTNDVLLETAGKQKQGEMRINRGDKFVDKNLI